MNETDSTTTMQEFDVKKFMVSKENYLKTIKYNEKYVN